MSERFIFEPHGGYGTNDPDGDPWPFGYISVVTGDGIPQPLFELNFVISWAPEKVDRLLAEMLAAPDLYEALDFVRPFFALEDPAGLAPNASECLDRIDAAIARARGEAS